MAKEIKIPSNQESCDGFTKKHVSKSRVIDDNLRNDEIDNLMMLASETEDYDEALNYYDEILEKYDYYKALNEKGFILINLYEFNRAIDCFNKSLELTKNNYDAHIGKSIAYNELLKLEDSINMGYELEIRANLRVACILNEEGYYYKYKLFKEIGDFKGALKSLNKYLKANPQLFNKDREKYFSFLFDNAEINFFAGNLYDAFHMFHQFLRFNSDDIDALMYMGMITPYFCKYDYSFKCFDKIFEIDSSIFEAMLLKAELLTYLNRYLEAIDCFNKCPIGEMPTKYKQLLNHAKNQIENETGYYGVSIVRNSEYNYVYTFYKKGLRKIYSYGLFDLRNKIENKGRRFKKIIYCKDFTLEEYISAYHRFPELPTDYKDTISGILNNTFAKNLNDNKINISEILESKTPLEQEIIKYLIDLIKRYLKFSRMKNKTGFFGVETSTGDSHWKYTDWINQRFTGYIDYYADTLDDLERIVKEKGLFWFILNEDLAKQSRERDLDLNYGD